MQSPNHQQARSQNKGLSRASWLWTGPSPTRDRQARAARARRGQSQPREASYTKLQADFIANQDFLGFWTVDILREGCSQRSAPQKRHTAHLRRCAVCTPRKPSGRDRGGNKLQQPCSPSTWSPKLLGPGKGTKHRPKPSLCLCRVPENLNLSGLDLGSACKPGPASDSSLAEQPRI